MCSRHMKQDSRMLEQITHHECVCVCVWKRTASGVNHVIHLAIADPWSLDFWGRKYYSGWVNEFKFHFSFKCAVWLEQQEVGAQLSLCSAPCINLDTRQRWLLSFTPRPLHSRWRNISSDRTRGLVSPTAGLDFVVRQKSCPAGNQITFV
jgi:hypothetical protein